MTAAEQIEELANFIMAEIPGEPSVSEGAVDTAIRLLRQHRDHRCVAQHSTIAGCVYDFASFLSSRDETLILGSAHGAAPVADAAAEFLKNRRIDDLHADVRGWSDSVLGLDVERPWPLHGPPFR